MDVVLSCLLDLGNKEVIQMTTDQAIKILNGAIKKPNTIDGYLGQALTMAINALENRIEIIRCKDCKWCSEHYDTDGNVPYWVCINWDAGTDADGFCHEAELRGDSE